MKDNLGGVDVLINNAAGDRSNTLCGNSDITFLYTHFTMPLVLSTSSRQFKQCKGGWVIDLDSHYNPVQQKESTEPLLRCLNVMLG